MLLQDLLHAFLGLPIFPPIMTEILHWLPIASRIKFKVLLLVSKSQLGLAPSYLTDFHSFIHCRHLYSVSSSGATQKRSCTNFMHKPMSSVCVYIRFIRKKTSVDKPLLEYMNKKLNTR